MSRGQQPAEAARLAHWRNQALFNGCAAREVVVRGSKKGLLMLELEQTPGQSGNNMEVRNSQTGDHIILVHSQ